MSGRIVRAASWVTVAALAVACAPPVDTSWHTEGGVRWRALDVRRGGHDGFTALAASATGLTHRNDVDDEHALANRHLLLGSGVAIGDVDGDGLPDIFLGSVEKPAALYHNAGHFHFEDVTAASGLKTDGLAITGVVLADIDGDGDLDLIAGTLGGPIKLWTNDGKGHFTDATASSGLDSGFAATTLTLADVDGNGTLDLYVATYKKRNALDALTPQQRTFEQVVRKVGTTYQVKPELAAEYRVEDRPDLGGVVRSQRAERDLFYLNDGKGHFKAERIEGPRFRDAQGKPLTRESDYFTLAARFYDFNGDGAPDLYACNDFEDPDEIWLNDGKGNFRLAPPLAFRETSNTCMSVDFADVDRDGFPDLFTADMLSPRLAERQRQIPTHTPLPKQVGLPTDRGQWMRNTLQHARGDGTFASVGDFAGVSASDWTWGSAFLDVDLDGYEDLLVVNGHRWDVRDADTFDHIRNVYPRVPWNREQGEFPKLAAHSVAFHNSGRLTFDDASRRWGFGADSAISNAIALGDLDGDGALDVVVGRLDGTPVVYRNESGAPRVAVRLRGKDANSGGVGATVRVRASGLPEQSRELTAGGYYLSGSEPLLVFAAGRDTAPVIEVRWRDGSVDIVHARANREYEITEGAAPGKATPPVAPDTSASMFTDATAMLGGHTHVESAYDDYQRQPLLPAKLSQFGPGVAWVDLDGDGHDELIVGAGAGGKLTVLRNGGVRFVAQPASGATASGDLTAVVPVSRAGGGIDILAGQSSYEAKTPADAASMPGVLSYRATGAALAPAANVTGGDSASVGALSLGDVNGDGRPDLFIGSRVVPGDWPLPRPSRLLLRTANGGWVADSVNAPVLRALGLVTAATWSDVNGDGWADLIVSTEWGPVRVLLNDHGRLRDATKELGLGDAYSRWNGVATGDFDGDGRMDIVATSWGRNAPFAASVARPHSVLVGDFGGRSLGLVFVRRDSVTGAEMPLESFARLGVAIPAVREKIGTFAEYSRTTADELMRAIGAKAPIRLGATTYDHTVFLNRGDHFEAHALPDGAQLAPAMGIVVADFDGDGNEDLFLGQNVSATEISTPRLDAGAGVLLLGDGKGGFRALSVRESGIAVLGDARGAAAADYDGDGRVDLVVGQNGAATTLWHNRKGAPGVRVSLDGGPDNPLGIGAVVRAVRGSARGPAREVHGGGGHLSFDSPTIVLGGAVDSVVVRWPGGREDVTAVPRGARNLRVRASSAAAPTSSRSR